MSSDLGFVCNVSSFPSIVMVNKQDEGILIALNTEIPGSSTHPYCLQFWGFVILKLRVYVYFVICIQLYEVLDLYIVSLLCCLLLKHSINIYIHT